MNKTTDQPMENRIVAWLESQGYPLEMHVARLFEQAGFDVTQSTYYIDPETDTAREIDVLARAGICIEETFAFLRYSIECKRAADKPWILFTRENRIIDFEYADWYCANQTGWDYLIHAAIDEKIDALALNYHRRERIGYGLTAAFTSGDDACYKAVQSAVRCAIASLKMTEDRSFGRSVEIVIPVIILDGRLFESYLDSEGAVVVRDIGEGVFLWDGIVAGRTRIAVHIVTKMALGQFVANSSAMKSEVISDWEVNLERILDEMAGYRAGIDPEAEHNDDGEPFE